MDNQNIYRKALQILDNREDYWELQAYDLGKTYTEQKVCRAKSDAYYSAKCILYYAMAGDLENLSLLEKSMGI